MMRSFCSLIAIIVILSELHAIALGDEPVANEKSEDTAIAFFEKRIRPVLVEQCYSCHAESEKTIEGGLRLDNALGLRKGGNSGPALIAGDPAHSLIMLAISHKDEKLRMPPETRLADEIIRDFEQWIAMGAADPRTDAGSSVTTPSIELDEKQKWAFAIPADPEVPTVRNALWPRNDIDRFLLAKIEAAELVPLPEVDKPTWLRRVSFDLIGLPPSVAELNDFLLDDSAGAYGRVVDRLLSSPHYGERWARHWFDVIHYADTTGCNSDFPVPQMVRYRNWVIDALNRDMPYDTFVRQQLAGDILADGLPETAPQEERNALVIATGFIANARRFGSRHEDYPQHLTIEDSIDMVGRSFLGVSLACARCHDHKFDPITNQDYYSLYSYFHNTQYPWPGIETEGAQRDFAPLIPKDRYEAAVKAKADRKKRLRDEVKRLENELKSAKDEAKAELSKQLAEAKQHSDSFGKRPLEIEMAYAVTDKPKREPVRVQYKGDPTKLGPEVIPQTPASLGGKPLEPSTEGSGRLALADWLASSANPLTARVMMNRLWKHHFGIGIVSTPNDFGRQGKAPSHPELLDHLSHRFIQSGWSLKDMHRYMVLSQAYRSQSVGDPAQEAKDPSNLLLRGYRRQRLDAESIRDAILCVADSIDRKPGDQHPFPKQQDWKFTQHNPFKATYDTNKRSVYVMTQRIQRHPYLAVFDGADPSTSTAARNVSTTPLQALYLLNDEFVHVQAEKLAKRLLAHSQSIDERVRFAFSLCLGRAASGDEVHFAREFVSKVQSSGTKPEAELAAWSSLARSLFRLNEFVYVD